MRLARLYIENMLINNLSEKSLLQLILLRSLFFGEKEIKLLPCLVDRKKCCIDIGANRGIYSYYLSKLSKHVFAYEPNPNLAKFLDATVKSNVTVKNIALSDSIRNEILNVPIIDGHETHNLARVGKSFKGTALQIPIKLTTLDREEHKDIGFIKIDVEGHEMNVLKGGESIIREYLPNMIIEIEQRHSNISILDTISYILDQGYYGYFFYCGNLCNITEFNVDKHQLKYLTDGTATITSNRYVNNFIFTTDKSII